MTQSRPVVVLLVALVLSVSFAVPAENVPETAYDESESLRCAGTPVIFIAASEAVGEATAAVAGWCLSVTPHFPEEGLRYAVLTAGRIALYGLPIL